MHRHGARAVFLHETSHRVIGRINRVTLGGDREIHHGLRDRKFTFRRPQALINVCGFKGQLRPSGISQRNVFNRHPHHAPRDVAGVAVQHPAHPVKGGVGVAAAYAFMQRTDLVVKVLPTLIKAPYG